ncbi:Transcriptional regulatory protein DegU [bioreactor metagenome]|uniref:Transcriptional regulatory protein DegU n=1 Tax=bioreactor metagenome TaxID=1076179 RepID=A0A644XCK8_9ZZZZ
MKLMLVDDHPLFLEGLKYLLSTHGINVVGMAYSGMDALEKARALHPDVILMDIKMPECDGISAMKLIKAEMPDVKVVMLTTSDEEEDLFEAIKYGASGYLLKNINAEELLSMLSDLESGEVLLSPGLALQTLHEFRSIQSDGGSKTQTAKNQEREKLTERQLEILELVSEGKTYKETGKELGISERTVKYHMGRIIELLHYKNRAQVIAYATRIGITEEK